MTEKFKNYVFKACRKKSISWPICQPMEIIVGSASEFIINSQKQKEEILYN